MTCGRRMAIRMKAMLKRTERNTKGEACSRAFFTTTKVTPQISEQNVSDRSAFRRRRMGGRLRQVHVSVFAKRIGVHGARVQHRGRSGKVTLSVNNAGMKFQYSTLNKLYVVSTAKEIPGRAPACTDWKGRRARLYFYQTKDRPYAGELNTIQFF